MTTEGFISCSILLTKIIRKIKLVLKVLLKNNISNKRLHFITVKPNCEHTFFTCYKSTYADLCRKLCGLCGLTLKIRIPNFGFDPCLLSLHHLSSPILHLHLLLHHPVLLLGCTSPSLSCASHIFLP